MKYFNLIILLTCLLSDLKSQEPLEVMSYNDFMVIVLEHHPVARQANIVAEKGDANLTMSRGAFDPKLKGNINQKYFKSDNYYSYINAGLEVPTRLGFSLEAGFTENQGSRLNPASYTPTDGLWHAGIKWDVGRGLLIDERRAALRQAKVFVEQSQSEQRLLLNELIYDAANQYWKWYKLYNQLETYEEAVRNAEFRLTGVLQAVEFGDKPAVDTLKAVIQIQNQRLKLEQAKLKFIHQTNKIQAYLWQDGFIPRDLKESVIPFRINELADSMFVPLKVHNRDSILSKHPKINMVQNKVEQAKIEYRLSMANLAPSIQLKYQPLTTSPEGLPDNFNENDYTWGAKVAYPLFLRKERGKMRLNKLKLEDYQMELVFTEAKIKAELISAEAAQISLLRQHEIYKDAASNYKNLLNAEKELFEIGEGSLFLVNTRENEYIDAQIKLISLIADAQLAKLNYYRVSGLLYP